MKRNLINRGTQSTLYGLVVAFLLLLFSTNAWGQNYFYLGATTGCSGIVQSNNCPPTSTASQMLVPAWYYTWAVGWGIYPASEMNQAIGEITSVAFHWQTGYTGPESRPCYVLLYETTENIATQTPPLPLGGNVPHPSSGPVSQWVAAGAHLVAGPINMSSANCLTGQWTTFDCSSNPYVYNGGNLVVVILDYGGGYSSSIYGYMTVYNDPDGINRGMYGHNDGTYATPYAAFTGYGYSPTITKFNVRLGVNLRGFDNVTVGPGGVFLQKGEVYRPPTPQYNIAKPRFSFDMMNVSDPSMQYQVKYWITGPEPSTDTVYMMVDPNTPSQKYINVTKTMGTGPNYTFNYDVQRAEGIAAFNTAYGVVQPDYKSLDLRESKGVKAGKYTVHFWSKANSSLPQYNTPTKDSTQFDVVVPNDVIADNILQPNHLSDYPITTATGIKIQASIRNGGTQPLDSFYARAFVYEVDYNPTTKEVTRLNNGVPVDTFPKNKNILNREDYAAFWPSYSGATALQTGQSVILDEKDFGNFYPSKGGWYEFEVFTWYADPTIADMEMSNNIYPRDKVHHIVRIQYEKNPVLTRISQPNPDEISQWTLGRTIYMATGVRNDGLVDISPNDNINIKTEIYKKTATGKYDSLAWSNQYVLDQAGVGEGERISICVDKDTKDKKGWLIDATGDFEVRSTVTWAGKPAGLTLTPPGGVNAFFKVLPGIAGTYKIGAAQDYHTINAAVEDVYTYGVEGDVTFELTDQTYTERLWNDTTKRDAPAIDLRSRIPMTKNPEGRIYQIKFVPSYKRSHERGSVTVNLESLTGVGIWLGATSDRIAVDNAMVNIVDSAVITPAVKKAKNYWAFNQGNITFDGGENRSLRFTMKVPNSQYATGEFRAPFYLTNAWDVAIKNCIIEDGLNQPRSLHYLLPGNTFNGPVVSWTNDYEKSSGVANKTYSAGVVIRSLPPYQDRFEENRFQLDSTVCYNNVISNNEISQFTYGVVNIGINFFLRNTPHLIDVVDTLQNITKSDMDKNSAFTLQKGSTRDTNGSIERTTYTYLQNSQSSPRYMTYYRLYALRNIVDGTTSSFVEIVDSAAGGVRNFYNHNNVVEGNQIYNIGRAGVFFGNEKDGIIRGNRIHGVIGQVVDANGIRRDESVDCAGILLGGRQRSDVSFDGFGNVRLQIYNNEISNISSKRSASGIKYEQALTVEKISSLDTRFPDAQEKTQVYSNIIWGIIGLSEKADRFGINLSISRRVLGEDEIGYKAEDTTVYATSDPTYFFRKLLIANNTVIMEADNYNLSAGYYVGMFLQKIKNARIINNAIEMFDTTQAFGRTNDRFAAAVYYQGPLPSEVNVNIDYNDYAIHSGEGSLLDAYRYVNQEIDGRVLDVGYRGEYYNLLQWQNWTKEDVFSMSKPFAQDMVIHNGGLLPKMRIKQNPGPLNSPLDDHGIFVSEAATDIDGIVRNIGDQGFDIGAQYFVGEKLSYDLELINMISPATYKANIGPFKDAEYFMVDNKPVVVKVLVRNNGSDALLNRRMVLYVFEEPKAVNNVVAGMHTANYNSLNYNNEIAVYQYNVDYPSIPIPSSPDNNNFFKVEKVINVMPGEGLTTQFQVDFEIPKGFNTYWDKQQQEPDFAIPYQWTTMTSNVTPRYKFVVKVLDDDQDNSNNTLEKDVRFFVKRSKRNVLVTAYNTYTPLDVNPSHIVNQDYIAGRLNLDTLIVGLNSLGMEQHKAVGETNVFDFDVLDRKVWDYRSVDFTMYQTVFYSDELEQEVTRWKLNMYDTTQRYFQKRWYSNAVDTFLKNTNGRYKKNLVIASEEFTSNICRVDSINDIDPETLEVVSSFYKSPIFVDTTYLGGGIPPREITDYMRKPYRYESKDFGTLTSKSLGGGDRYTIQTTGWTNGSVTDAFPTGRLYIANESLPGTFGMGLIYDTLTHDASIINISTQIPQVKRVAAYTYSSPKNNVIQISFDWRHFKQIDMLLMAIDNFLRNNGSSMEEQLPLALYNFDATPVSNRVELEWGIASGNKFRQFNIERADVVDGNTSLFQDVATIFAKDNANDVTYNTTDYNLGYGNTYAYRLGLIDLEGNKSYSDKRVVTIEEAQFNVSEVSPNPVTNDAKFTITAEAGQFIYAAVYDITGSEIAIICNDDVTSGNHTFNINVAKMAAGTYNLIVRNSNGRMITKTFNVVK